MPSRIHGAVLVALVLVVHGAVAQSTPAWLDLSRSFSDRARSLVSQMTLEEKVSQMMDVAPAIDRLGVPSYNWWNEALHGVARSGLATVFPQAIGLAATWDDSLMFRVATVISDEARAKNNQYLRENSRGRYQGLTFWSPNINIVRDPRWGRGQETYGEDPFLTGRMAVQFIRGMQGNDPKYLKTVSTVKHFAVHSGPDPLRHRFDAVVSDRDLHETYLAQFEAGIREGGAGSVMCSYNRVDGAPSCGNEMLLQAILRGQWGFKGYVVSDCGAIDDIYQGHHVVATAAEAAAVGVRTGTDLECGDTYRHLVDAVHRGLITESTIDTSLVRLFTARMKLGMFDPPDSVSYTRIQYSDLDSPGHHDLAREAARESMVLLKNAAGILPLRKDLGRIAVIGPNADQADVLNGNYNGTPSDPITPLRGIREAVSKQTQVTYAIGSDLAPGVPVYTVVPSAVLGTSRGKRGLDAAYFADTTVAGTPAFRRTDSTVDFDWHSGAPRSGLDSNDFSVQWIGTIRPPASGTYRLALAGSVRYRLQLDDSTVVQSIDASHNGEPADARRTVSAPLTLEGGHRYRIAIEAAESYGAASLRLLWAIPQDELERRALDAAYDADAVVLVLGLTNQLEGEEMNVKVPGFAGGDRTTIDLPAPQEDLLRRVTALGRPTVLVLLNGSALAVNWAQEHVPAIVEAWYPGQAGGAALADVLFGDYNPAGRLPVSFYRTIDDVPPFDDYRMANRTYRFFTGPVLYPFGFGLSYTTFAYDSLRTARDTVGPADTVTVTASITNTGTRRGDEVVQLYVQHLGSSVPRPIKDLRAFRRVTLDPRQSRDVELRFPVSSLAYWDTTTPGWRVESEPVRIEVGSSSADIRLDRILHVLAP